MVANETSKVSEKPAFASWDAYRDFALVCRHGYRSVLSKNQQAFLDGVRDTCGKRILEIEKDKQLWRAQLGHDWYEREQDGHRWQAPYPFPKERMVPNTDRAREGRVNPKGIAVLYLATTRDCAMSEVRPWLGALVSVAIFALKKKVALVDCSRGHNDSIFNYLYVNRVSTPEEVEKMVWINIDQAFSEPVMPSDESADYVPTQVIAELFKSEGCDGLLYKSHFGEKGYNVVLFDPTVAEVRRTFLYKVSKQHYEFEEEPV